MSGPVRVYLSSWDLEFRGAFRLKLSLRSVERAMHEGGWVTVESSEGAVAFQPGAADAPKWVDKILHPPSRLDKLDIAAGQRVSVLGLDDEDFEAELAERVPDASWGAPLPDCDRILAAAHDAAELDGHLDLVRFLKPAGALWLLWPKGRKDFKRSDVFAHAHAAGLVDIKVASFSPVYSALKFVRPVEDR